MACFSSDTELTPYKYKGKPFAEFCIQGSRKAYNEVLSIFYVLEFVGV
jgi:hypothetical protein